MICYLTQGGGLFSGMSGSGGAPSAFNFMNDEPSAAPAPSGGGFSAFNFMNNGEDARVHKYGVLVPVAYIGGWGMSPTGKSSRFVRSCVRAVRF